MARQKKDDTGELLVSIEQFTRTRDQVRMASDTPITTSSPPSSSAESLATKRRKQAKRIVAHKALSEQVIISLTNLQAGLTHVQNGLAQLLRVYIQHTSSILSGGADTLESLQLPPHLAAHANAAVEAAQNAGDAVAAAISAPGAPETGKKKRKRAEKKERDPNAPKKPLTAAFLFAREARPIVKKDLEEALGPDQKLEPNAVKLEIDKRWNEMREEDKEKWKASYRESFQRWREEYDAYMASKGEPVSADVDMHDDEEPTDEAEVGALDSDASSDAEDNGESGGAKAASPPAASSKTPRPSKRQKTAPPQINGATVPVPIAPAVAAAAPTPIPVPGSAKPAQTHVPPPSFGVDAPLVTPLKEKKDKKKKDKSGATPAAEDANGEETKKKSKSGRTTRGAEAENETAEKDKEKEKEPKKKRDRSKRKSEGVTA
ncbi:uncharacterized protein EI97DRAFT_449764 [Westerdykella ornata]|uniref:HMG box domain-containing protein n=1 Tax=Westerdykella ornata TaxID=318751 RepID=A0A6A6JL48_WESOR|nr:uncharacterized protein EI97DRAFT_449764 [Westerdykella ornata]KAF2276965.1 hypothetical protein EI97DRAFT_449764 [Westerdykella ornata]